MNIHQPISQIKKISNGKLKKMPIYIVNILLFSYGN